MELAIALLGVALGGASLAWQARSHFLAGGRARLQISEVQDFAGGEEKLCVRVMSVGRMPISVVSWAADNGERRWYAGGPAGLAGIEGPHLPCRIDPGERAQWLVPVAVQSHEWTARVTLGDERVIVSREGISVWP